MKDCFENNPAMPQLSQLQLSLVRFSFHMDGHKENNAQICRFRITTDVKHLYLTPPRFLESLWAEVNTGKALI